MLDRLYARIIALAASRHAIIWLAVIAFAEASVFPLPPDIMLVPMVLACRARAFRLAAICTAASVCGAILGWTIGSFLLEYIAMPIVRFYHAQNTLLVLQERFREWGVWIILIKGLTPIPFKFVTIASGAAHLPLAPFLLACAVTRGARFFLLAALLRRFGAPIQAFIERRLPLVAGLFALALIGGIVALKYI
ncbi:DedA family protein [Komagataeibacter intermedius]|uniref:Cytochrome B561 n=2 Tax=Komagataeibacter intermedius TaxID=66229 RepID=A0A0N1FIC1_9PROT|nr:YqaA family protein [Komagataeibacter intermedius]KPH85175.1 cytochrome B561 [Komagataeibacter intermedius AF2]MCF3638209.1 DedA family protein [Komagataeibacter intermedius]GAN85736.1 alkaline phosphatase DedA [Komagataeibacter intermedius TF2]GBQ78410.1 alkaline phosphatase [Komagataeibacter intermedius NRIC 0521]